jgi:uncharacterized protein YdbL (DUF1318 family)
VAFSEREEETMKRLGKVSFLCLVMLGACVTVNLYFPAAEVQKAADKIVEDVREKEQKAPVKPGSSSWLYEQFRAVSRLSLGAECAYAQVNVDVSTPAIRALRASMQNRFPQLKPFYDKSAVGENNNGFIEVRGTAGLNLQEQARINQLVDQENKDRTALYREIMTANKFGPEALPQIQKIFANSWRNNSQAGWSTQNDAGQWVKK